LKILISKTIDGGFITKEYWNYHCKFL